MKSAHGYHIRGNLSFVRKFIGITHERTFAANEENLGAPVCSRLNQHAGSVRSQ